MKNLFILFRTLRHLKLKQLFYRFAYLIRKYLRKTVRFKYRYNLYRKGKPVILDPFLSSFVSYKDKSFTFLNKTIRFSKDIEWDSHENGKLWTYNLNYFDYLNQPDFDTKLGLEIIYDFVDKLPILKNANEPYTISLRGINWIKFLSVNNIERKAIDQYLYSQYRVLLDNIEYHLLGNHLLENGFSLLFGGYYFKGDELYNKGKEIVTEELEEQILQDGAHFELAPMYHKIILVRLLDAINLVKNNKEEYEDDAFEAFLREKASLMLGWLKNITFENGKTPHVNDSTDGIIQESSEIFKYAQSLKIESAEARLSDSGYRVFKSQDLELFVDVGNIGPDYIPGHAHADTFNFLLNYKGKSLIVEAGISTYDTGNKRQRERGTSSHNTVRYLNQNSSEVWGSFRVGRKAYVTIDEESDNHIIAHHDGYRHLDVNHYRKFEFEQNCVLIEDEMFSSKSEVGFSNAYIHFHPDVSVDVSEGEIHLGDLKLTFEGDQNIRIKEYYFAKGYNEREKAKFAEIEFVELLKTKIEIKE